MTRALAISAGELDQRITLQEGTTSQDAVGQVAETFADVAGLVDLWARARPLRGREFFAAGATQAQETIVFGVRWRPGFPMTGRLRVWWNGLPYPLTAPPVDVEAAHHTIELICTGGRPT